MAKNYPVNPTVPLGWELPDGFGGLSAQDLSYINLILRSMYHSHEVPANVNHPSARFTYNSGKSTNIGNGASMAFDSVTVLGGEHAAGAWWDPASPSVMRAPERGVYLFEHSGGWLSTAVPSTWKIYFSGAGIFTNSGGDHNDKPANSISGNEFGVNHSRLVPLNTAETVTLRWDHTADGGLGNIPTGNYVTVTKVGPYN